MIDKKTHDTLVAEWKKVGRGIYQKWSRIHRLQFFLKFIHHFKNKKVLEIGCNAGLYGYEISKIAESYVGIDKGDYYISQANVTKKIMKMKNATFFNCNVKNFIKADQQGKMPEYNALFASFVLYHLTGKEINRLAAHVLPKCDVVIIQTRLKKRTPWRKYNPLKLNKLENVEKYLKDAGFECKSSMGKDGKYGITIATRSDNGNDQRKCDGDRARKSKSAGGRGASKLAQDRIPEGSTVLSPEREAASEGTDGLLLSSQKRVGDQGLLQDRQRGVLQAEPEGCDERVEETDEAGPIQCDSEINENSKGDN